MVMLWMRIAAAIASTLSELLLLHLPVIVAEQ
jgi:hypothetical protein